MAEPIRRIVVAGDVTVDWFLNPAEAQDQGENWRQYPSMRYDAMPGGAMLLAEFLRRALAADATAATGPAADVAAPAMPGDLREIPPARVIHSNVRLGEFADGGKGPRVMRVDTPMGYIGPRTGRPESRPPAPNPPAADLVVLDDAGNGFREDRASWPAALDAETSPLIVYKMSRPLFDGDLWKLMAIKRLANGVLVVNAGDLRRLAGVQISRALSWERTAKELVFEMARSEALAPLGQCGHVVVLMESDGAIVCRMGETVEATLLFDPLRLEGGWATSYRGRMMGHMSLVTATLAAALAREGPGALVAGVERGLARSRRLLTAGYVKTDAGVDYPHAVLFAKDDAADGYSTCRVDPAAGLGGPDMGFWRILDAKTRNTRLEVAEEIVRSKKPRGLKGVPVGVFGKLETIDRAEIEHFSAIRSLIGEYLANPRPERPLCFAVFGPPGSGKSFGVKQVAKSLNRGDEVEMLTFNISQFRDYRDLVAGLHRVRDIVLSGRVPLVFFDEFDASGDGVPLGWLKYFLAPMQDAEFRDGESTYHVGKAIFVFAGGTKSCFEDFVRNVCDEEGGPSGCTPEAAVGARKFREAKGPDFVSRLRGFINIMGPNRQRRDGDDDEAFILRRAKLLRILLGGVATAAGLFDSKGTLRIDDGVLRALLHVSRYAHGARSMQAILEMSRLAGRERFDQAALPPAEQLQSHVDAEEFLFLAGRERYQSMLRRYDLWNPEEPSYRKNESAIVEAVARMIHEDYIREREREGNAAPPAFDDLSEDKKNSNRDAAEDIPHKLRVIHHGLRRVTPGRAAGDSGIIDADLESLARLEHDRWCREQRLQGWTYGSPKDVARKRSPYLVAFDALPPDIQDFDRQAVRAIPRILAGLGYEIYRMVEE